MGISWWNPGESPSGNNFQLYSYTQQDTAINRTKMEDFSDDDAWGSDFDESIDELYSQEIEDNKINETLEAQLRSASHKNTAIKNAIIDKLGQVTPSTTEVGHPNIPTASTGAIPKRGFSYLVNSVLMPQNNPAVLQKIIKPVPRDKNIGVNSIPQRNVVEAVNIAERVSFQTNSWFSQPESRDKNIKILNENDSASITSSASNTVESQLIPQFISENHATIQTITKPEPRDKEIEALNENQSNTVVITSISSVNPTNGIKVIADQGKQYLNKTHGMKMSPGKLKPEAFKFLNQIPGRIPNIDKDVKTEKKHLIPTGFIDVGNLHHSQMSIKNTKSHYTEINSPEPSAPPHPDHDNYEPINEGDQNKREQFLKHDERASLANINHEEITKPALPSRPPPIFKHKSRLATKTNPPPIKAKPTSPVLIQSELKSSTSRSVKDDIINKESIVSPDVKKIEGMKTKTHISSSRNTIPPNVISRPLPPVPLSDQPNLNMQSNSSPATPLLPEILARPLTLIPTSDQPNVTLQPKPCNASPIPQELISRPLIPISEQISLPSITLETVAEGGQSGISNKKSVSEINNTPVETETPTTLYSSDGILEIDITAAVPRNVINEHIQNETQIFQPMQSAQQKLAQIICSQNQVESAIFQSQKRMSMVISSLRQDSTTSITSSSSEFSAGSLQNLSHNMDDGDYLQSSVRSSNEVQKPIVPPRKISNPLIKDSPFNISRSPIRTNSNSPPYPDIETFYSHINRPSLPQKLKTTQRSLSCSSLVQSFRDMSFAMWNPPVKEKRISAGSPYFDKHAKEFTKENNENFRPKGSSVLNIDEPRDVKAPKKRNPLYIFSEKNLLSQHAWYHDIDAREAQRRLLNFIDQNGAFLIRPSTRKSNEIQHTACIVFSGRIINMHIRRKANGQFALGTEKEGELMFPSMFDLIKYHQEVPIESSGHPSSVKSFSACLRVTPPKS